MKRLLLYIPLLLGFNAFAYIDNGTQRLIANCAAGTLLLTIADKVAPKVARSIEPRTKNCYYLPSVGTVAKVLCRSAVFGTLGAWARATERDAISRLGFSYRGTSLPRFLWAAAGAMTLGCARISA